MQPEMQWEVSKVPVQLRIKYEKFKKYFSEDLITIRVRQIMKEAGIPLLALSDPKMVTHGNLSWWDDAKTQERVIYWTPFYGEEDEKQSTTNTS